MIHFFFSWFCLASGQTIYDDTHIQSFNLIFSAGPLIIRALIDTNVETEDGEIVEKFMPVIYKEGRDDPLFSYFAFFVTKVKAICQCAVVFFFSYFAMYQLQLDGDGNIADIWVFSTIFFTNIILVLC